MRSMARERVWVLWGGGGAGYHRHAIRNAVRSDSVTTSLSLAAGTRLSCKRMRALVLTAVLLPARSQHRSSTKLRPYVRPLSEKLACGVPARAQPLAPTFQPNQTPCTWTIYHCQRCGVAHRSGTTWPPASSLFSKPVVGSPKLSNESTLEWLCTHNSA